MRPARSPCFKIRAQFDIHSVFGFRIFTVPQNVLVLHFSHQATLAHQKLKDEDCDTHPSPEGSGNAYEISAAFQGRRRRHPFAGGLQKKKEKTAYAALPVFVVLFITVSPQRNTNALTSQVVLREPPRLAPTLVFNGTSMLSA